MSTSAADDGADEADEERLNRTRGPFDASEVDDDDVERIDLGALRIPPGRGDAAAPGAGPGAAVGRERARAGRRLRGAAAGLRRARGPSACGATSAPRSPTASPRRAAPPRSWTDHWAASWRRPSPRPARTAGPCRTPSGSWASTGHDGSCAPWSAAPPPATTTKAAPLVELVRTPSSSATTRPGRRGRPCRCGFRPQPRSRPTRRRQPTDEHGGRRPRSAEDLRPFERGPEITEVR